jgi:hypothetical protein
MHRSHGSYAKAHRVRFVDENEGGEIRLILFDRMARRLFIGQYHCCLGSFFVHQ